MSLRTVCCLGLLICAMPLARAEEAAETDTSTEPSEAADSDTLQADRWNYVLMPYLWALNNTLTIGTDEYLQSDVTPFAEAIRDYDYGLLFYFEAHKPPWVIYMDLLLVKLTGRSRSLGLPVNSDIRQLVVEGAIARQFDFGWHTIDLLAGLRFFRLRSDVNVRYIDRFIDHFIWFEPLVGLRQNIALGEKWGFDWRIDAGGFGLGSKLTWQVNANIHYDINERYSVNLGYRHLDIDYQKGSKTYDSIMSGPMLGMTTRF